MALSQANEGTVIDVIGHLEPFKHNSLRATLLVATDGVLVGSLPAPWQQHLTMAIMAAVERQSRLYVLYSYHTPIAWLPMEDGSHYVIPRVQYSKTTTEHQDLVRRAFEAAGIREEELP